MCGCFNPVFYQGNQIFPDAFGETEQINRVRHWILTLTMTGSSPHKCKKTRNNSSQKYLKYFWL
jgi:hypothetical protein